MANTHTRNSEEWNKVGEIEDAQGSLAGIELIRQQIEHGALFEQSYDNIYYLSIKMYEELRKFKLYLKRVRDIQEQIARNERN